MKKEDDIFSFENILIRMPFNQLITKYIRINNDIYTFRIIKV